MAPKRPGRLAGRSIVLGVSGSIAVIKAPQLVVDLAAAGARVQVALTAAAQEFVTARTFAALADDPVLTDADLADDLARLLPAPDAFLIAPASARSIADVALNGPGLLAAIDRRRGARLILAPAMESRMYEHPATQGSIRALTARGAQFIGPAAGRLASGATGRGRLVEPTEILTALIEILDASAGSAGQPAGQS